MYSTEPEKARPDGVEGEVLSTFTLAGSRGNLRTVLTQENVILERQNGNFLRLGFNKIEAMRHHQFHIIPHWCALISGLLIYASLRVLTGQMQVWSGVIGAAVIISWLGFRKSALTIDCGDAGTYTLFGPVKDLIKFRVLTDRIKDGLSLDKAREGLDEVILSEYPSTSIFEELVEIIEVEPEKSDDALTMAMADLINKTKSESETVESNHLEQMETENLPESRDPLLHGSISRARQVRTELRSPPAHSGWANVANRTEVLRNENEMITPQVTQQIIQDETTIFPSTNSDDSFNLFGFDLDESEPKEDSFNMFGDSFGTTSNSYDDYERSEENQSSFSMMPESITSQNNQHGGERTVIPEKPFINSFQQTGYSNPLNQLGSTINQFEVKRSIEEPSPNKSLGIVSQAKGVPEENEVSTEVENKTVNLRRIKFGNGKKKLKRLKVNNKQTKRLTLSNILTPKLKTPSFFRRMLKQKRPVYDPNFSESNRTMDALKIQAHQTHEAQLAEALRNMNQNNEDLHEDLLEDISPELVEQKIPLSFNELKASNQEKENLLSSTGITRLD
ncbi:MAG: hypothetical protein CMA03_05355 [Euryarchaeota archaeon]|nr:hypothetical protein [Euryarchaeota archaeon]